MKKVNEIITIAILLLLGVLLGGCAGSFQAEDTVPVNAGINLGTLQVVEADAGLMFEWFSENNYWIPEEQAEVSAMYSEMVRVLTKLKKKTISGETDYHRLLYSTEDLTEVWLDLRPELQNVIDMAKPVKLLEDKFAVSTWDKIKVGMDDYLQANNIRLKAAKDGMDAATYAAFKEDAKGMLQLITPLLKSGIPGL